MNDAATSNLRLITLPSRAMAALLLCPVIGTAPAATGAASRVCLYHPWLSRGWRGSSSSSGSVDRRPWISKARGKEGKGADRPRWRWWMR